jgi:hypothetical protein
MITTLIVAAVIAAACQVAFGLARSRRTPKHPDLPMLDDVLKLARRERGPFGIRWLPIVGELRLSGVPLNVMVKENWAELLLPGLRKIWHTRMRSREKLSKRTEIYPVDTSTKAAETTQGIGELGTDGWNEFERNRRVGYDGFEKGFKQTLAHRTYAKGLIVQRELMEDNQYAEAGIPKEVKQNVEKLAGSAALHREKSAAALFNNAFTDAGVDNEGHPVAGPDGVGLCSTAHPLSPVDAATQSNEGVLALTNENVKATRLLMRRFTDDQGELVSIEPGTLLVPPELEEKALILVNTERDPDSAENAVNTNKNRFKVVVWDYLTDPEAWWMLDDLLKEEHLVWYDRVLPEFTSESDFDTTDAKYKGYMRFSRGFDAWQWIYGNKPA